MIKITAIAIPVTDQIRAKEFYLRIGFQVLADEPMNDNARWVQLGLPGTNIAVSLVTWFKEMPPGCLQGLVMSSNDIHADYAHCKQQGLHVSALTETAEGWFFNLKDPDGNGLSVQQQKGA